MEKEIKIATWNVNSVNARINLISQWIQSENPDVILLQELKCEKNKFPYSVFESLAYNIVVHGQKSYNGVAILSKFPMEDVHTTFENDPCTDQARFIETMITLPIGMCKVICLYAPNGGDVGSDKFISKLKFFDKLYLYLNKIRRQDEFLIIGGDFNIANNDADVYDPVLWQYHTCFTIEERKKLRAILNQGFIDTCTISRSNQNNFTWWDYRKKLDINRGIRIDYIISSPNLCPHIKSFDIGIKWRQEKKTSDHAPCILSIKR